MWNLILLSKSGCSICRDAREAIEEFKNECEFTFQELDISKHPKLWKKYGYDIPVLLINDREVARFHINIKKLRQIKKLWENHNTLKRPESVLFVA